MRRVIVLMLVFGFARSADAVLTFTVNGVEQPAEITLRQSEAVSLGIELYTGTIRYYDLDYALSNAQAEFIWGGYVDDYGNEFGPTQFPAPFDFGADFVICEPQHVRISTVTGLSQGSSSQSTGILGPPIYAPATIMTDLVLHCLEPTDVVLEITVAGTTEVDGELIPPGTLMHTLTIHQIPEPITMSILLLGSVFVLRRRQH